MDVQDERLRRLGDRDDLANTILAQPDSLTRRQDINVHEHVDDQDNTTARATGRGRSISTEEIKARIEAMFADDRHQSRPTSR